ncbi:DUF1016 family protein [Prevotella sp. AM34-19LB]|uniref:DUF1016 N-terminal domain-containing protein n=1 Tax=Prevotella sp. AM34-19LB TaxID=2292364 RepID=UPI000E5C97A9|nr:DUF1016 family protein [Prevotella sp. AM34-19LB]
MSAEPSLLGLCRAKRDSTEIEPEYGSGFGVRQLERCRQFYTIYPNANTLCAQLNWYQ